MYKIYLDNRRNSGTKFNFGNGATSNTRGTAATLQADASHRSKERIKSQSELTEHHHERSHRRRRLKSANQMNNTNTFQNILTSNLKGAEAVPSAGSPSRSQKNVANCDNDDAVD